MKIVYLANIRLPTEKAHGLQIMKMCEAFAKIGHDVELVIPTRRNPNFKGDDPFVYYGIENIFKITQLKTYDPTFLFALPVGTYTKGQIFFFGAALLWYLKKKNNEQALFYTRDELLLPLVLRFSKKVVWEGHAIPKRPQRFIKYFKACHKTIVLTGHSKQKLTDLGVSETNILVAADAVDLKIFDSELTVQEARQRLNLPKEKLILGYTGTYRTKNLSKGLETVLAALKIMTDPKIVFVAVGGAESEIADYKKLAEKMQLQDRVVLLPRVSQQTLAVYQKAFDLLLLPFPFNEHYAYFMSPLKLFEYMAAKRPIVAADLPSLREILNEDNAAFFEPGSPGSLADAVMETLRDPVRAQVRAETALSAVQNYTWENRAKKILEFTLFLL